MTEEYRKVLDVEDVLPGRVGRKAYHTPRLEDYGEVREVTQTGLTPNIS